MRYAAALIMAGLFLLGAFLLVLVGWEIMVQIERKPYLKQAQGEIIEIRLEKRVQRSRKGKPIGEYFAGTPIISFQTDSGETIIFEGQISAEASRLDEYGYKVGNKIQVVYDTEKKLPPTIESPLFSAGIAAAGLFGLIMMGTSVLFFKLFWRNKIGSGNLHPAPQIP